MTLVTDSLLAYIAMYGAEPPRFPTSGMVFWHPLDAWRGKAATGQTMTYAGSAATPVTPTATTYRGVPCCLFNADCLWRATTNVKAKKAAYNGTLSCWVACKDAMSNNYAIDPIVVVRASNTSTYYYGLWKNTSYARIRAGKRSGGSFFYYDGISNDTKWKHVAVQLQCAAGWETVSWTDTVWIDGVRVRRSTASVANHELTRTFIGNSNASTTNGLYIAGVRLYNRLLLPEEIAVLAAEYTPEN